MQQCKEEEVFLFSNRNLLLLLLAVARNSTPVTSSNRVGSKYFFFLFFFVCLMMAWTKQQQQKKSNITAPAASGFEFFFCTCLNFLRIISLSRLAAILSASKPLKLNYKNYCLLISLFKTVLKALCCMLTSKKQLVSIWFVVNCQQR